MRFAGTAWFAAVEDLSRLRDALGVPIPPGLPEVFGEPVRDPLGDLVSRYARTHGPFTANAVAERFGIGQVIAASALGRLAGERRVVEGEFLPHGAGAEWCDSEVLRRIRRRSLAALRNEVEPVAPREYARFLPEWQHVGGRLRGVDGVAAVIEQLEGARIPASAWESFVLPARVADYRPAMLDELTASGEVLWAGQGSLAGDDGWVSLHLADTAELTLPAPAAAPLDPLETELIATLGGGGGYFFRQLVEAVGATDEQPVIDALWRLAWAGLVTNDTFAPVRGLVAGRGAHKTAPATPRARLRGGSLSRRVLAASVQTGRAATARANPPKVAGRWAVLPLASSAATPRAHALGETLLERYGVVTRGSVMAEGVLGGFALAYRALVGLRGVRAGAPRLLHRRAGRCAVRLHRGRRPPAERHARPRDRARRDRSREPVRCRARLARDGRRRSSAGAQGRSVRRHRRRRGRVLPRARRAHHPRLHRRRRRAHRRGGRARRRARACGLAQAAHRDRQRPGASTAPCSTRRCARPASARRRGGSGSMPEGDTVYQAARRLDAALAGQVVTTSDMRVPAYATVDLSGERCTRWRAGASTC